MPAPFAAATTSASFIASPLTQSTGRSGEVLLARSGSRWRAVTRQPWAIRASATADRCLRWLQPRGLPCRTAAVGLGPWLCSCPLKFRFISQVAGQGRYGPGRAATCDAWQYRSMRVVYNRDAEVDGSGMARFRLASMGRSMVPPGHMTDRHGLLCGSELTLRQRRDQVHGAPIVPSRVRDHSVP
jgi:hypothetical protein